jgi:hypothetical protein
MLLKDNQRVLQGDVSKHVKLRGKDIQDFKMKKAQKIVEDINQQRLSPE